MSSSFEIVDDLHFRLHFSAPDADYIVGNLQLWAIPKKYFEQVGEEGFSKAPVGTGPWKFVSRSIKEDIKFEAFDDYWNKDARPTVKNLIVKIIPEDLTRVAAFKAGNVDWIDAVPLSAIDEIKKMPGVKTFTAISGNNLYIDFPSYQPTLAVQQGKGPSGGRAGDRHGRDHQERAVRPGRALRADRQGLDRLRSGV